MTVQIPLTRGLVALVDSADADSVRRYCWNVYARNHIRYAKRGVRVSDGRRRQITQYMHTFLTGWILTDHINGDGLDNRRCNLRPATDAQNQWNLRKHRGTSRFKGVSWHKRDRHWKAAITAGGRTVWLGYFADEEPAALAYDAAARRHFGEYAALNFPLPGERSALDNLPKET